MPSTGKALSLAIVVGTALTASAAAAATAHRAVPSHRPVYHRPVYNVVPADPGIISDRCLPVGPPCRTAPDSW